MPLQCRFYEKTYPEVGEIVEIVVRGVEAMGSYVELLEYKNIGGMILHSELSRRRIRSINKLIRVGRNEIVLVIRVDSEKGYIDLSKRRVSPEESKKCHDRFIMAKAVNQILRHVADELKYETGEQLEELYNKTAWHFDRKAKLNGAGAFAAFKRAVTDPTVFDECNLDERTLQALLQDIRHRLMPQVVKMRADFEVSCFTDEGIDAIKQALREGLKLSTEELQIKINLIAPPLYVMTTQSMDATSGLEHMSKVLKKIEETIVSLHGKFSVKEAPKVVSESDEADLVKQLEELEEANREVSGDDDDEDDDEEDGDGDD